MNVYLIMNVTRINGTSLYIIHSRDYSKEEFPAYAQEIVDIAVSISCTINYHIVNWRTREMVVTRNPVKQMVFTSWRDTPPRWLSYHLQKHL